MSLQCVRWLCKWHDRVPPGQSKSRLQVDAREGRYKQTPLMIAVQSESNGTIRGKIIACLLTAGANPLARDKDGLTAVRLASNNTIRAQLNAVVNEQKAEAKAGEAKNRPNDSDEEDGGEDGEEDRASVAVPLQHMKAAVADTESDDRIDHKTDSKTGRGSSGSGSGNTGSGGKASGSGGAAGSDSDGGNDSGSDSGESKPVKSKRAKKKQTKKAQFSSAAASGGKSDTKSKPKKK